MLPEIGHKFSSWAKEDQNLNELDELLMEHDLLTETPSGAGQNARGGISATIHVTRANGTGTPDQFDFEDVMDEFGVIEAGGAELEESRKNRAGNDSSGSGKNKQGAEDSNSFDLDNSDDLNRFIQKYETMLDGDGNNKKSNSKLGGATGSERNSSQNVLAGVEKQASGSKRTLHRDRSKDLDESWGSLQLQAE